MHAKLNCNRGRPGRHRRAGLRRAGAVTLLGPALALALMLTLPGSALAAGFKVTPHIANHTPIVNRKWPLRLTITRGRTKLSGSVRYEFMFDGSVVSHQPGHKFSHGVYRDTMIFPPNSLGEPLTLRILVTVPRYGTEHVDWRVRSKR